MCGSKIALLLAVGSVIAPFSAEAQTAPDSSQPSLSSICTDRPTKSNYACTVDEGHFQYEADIANGSSLHQDGVTTDTWLIVNPTIKYGLTPTIDLEANFSPFESVRTHDRTSGTTQDFSGVSDLYLRMKYNFLTTENGIWQATILPYIKAPTAPTGIGNGAVEGGLILPVNYKLSDTLTLTTVPEFDLLKNALDDGRHANTAQLINLGWSLPGNFTLYGELWGDWNMDPSGTVTQASADTALAYGVTPYLQLDIGMNFGLNKNTPNMQGYIGISQKF
jgi:hypothetical protein